MLGKSRTRTAKRYLKRRLWVICLIYLKRPLDRLDQPEKDSQHKDQNSDPERVPVAAIPSIIPQLLYCRRPNLIIRLLQHDQSVVPEFEVLDLTVISVKPSAPKNSVIRYHFLGHADFLKPFLRFSVGLREEKRKGAEGFAH